jgi:hypothetical protein
VGIPGGSESPRGCPAAANDLFLAADTHQRIYRHRVSLKQVGIAIAGRSERLKVNYRTTAEILAWSFGLFRGQRIDDMNEDLDTLAGCRSDVHGELPTLHQAPTPAGRTRRRRSPRPYASNHGLRAAVGDQVRQHGPTAEEHQPRMRGRANPHPR